MVENSVKQSVCGFKVSSISVKKAKDGEVATLVLRASMDDLTAGDFDVGSIMKALVSYQTSDNEVGLNLLMTK